MSAKLTPVAAAFQAQNVSNESDAKVYSWLQESSAREIEDFIQALAVAQKHNWLPYAQVALNIRLSEDAAKTADKMAAQNEILVRESGTLTKYTKLLYVVTVLLFVVAILQVIIMFKDSYDKWKEKQDSVFTTDNMVIPPEIPISNQTTN